MSFYSGGEVTLDIEPMRIFAGIEFCLDRIPDETTIPIFAACRQGMT